MTYGHPAKGWTHPKKLVNYWLIHFAMGRFVREVNGQVRALSALMVRELLVRLNGIDVFYFGTGEATRRCFGRRLGFVVQQGLNDSTKLVTAATGLPHAVIFLHAHNSSSRARNRAT